MARKNRTAVAAVETVAADEVTELSQEILNAPAIDPDVQREPRILPDLTVPTAPVETDKSIKMSMEDLEKVGVKNKSDAIRYLASLGYERSPIAKFLGIRYQHVNNVLGKELKRKVLPWNEKVAEGTEKTEAETEE